MTYTLFDLVYRSVREMSADFLVEGVATGGSTTTIIDTLERTEADDHWNGGTAFIVDTTDDAAPKGQYKPISDFTASSDTVTLQSALTAAVGSGDRYALLKPRMTYNAVVQAVNRAIGFLGRIPLEDTSLTTAANQTEYDLPTGITSLNLAQVWLQTITDDADDNRYIEVMGWDVLEGAIGSVDSLRLRGDLPEGRTIRLVYMADHPELYASSDKLADSVPFQRVIFRAALYCARWYRDRMRTKDFDQLIAELMESADRMDVMYPIPSPKKPSKPLLRY